MTLQRTEPVWFQLAAEQSDIFTSHVLPKLPHHVVRALHGSCTTLRAVVRTSIEHVLLRLTPDELPDGDLAAHFSSLRSITARVQLAPNGFLPVARGGCHTGCTALVDALSKRSTPATQAVQQVTIDLPSPQLFDAMSRQLVDLVNALPTLRTLSVTLPHLTLHCATPPATLAHTNAAASPCPPASAPAAPPAPPPPATLVLDGVTIGRNATWRRLHHFRHHHQLAATWHAAPPSAHVRATGLCWRRLQAHGCLRSLRPYVPASSSAVAQVARLAAFTSLSLLLLQQGPGGRAGLPVCHSLAAVAGRLRQLRLGQLVVSRGVVCCVLGAALWQPMGAALKLPELEGLVVEGGQLHAGEWGMKGGDGEACHGLWGRIRTPHLGSQCVKDAAWLLALTLLWMTMRGPAGRRGRRLKASAGVKMRMVMRGRIWRKQRVAR